MKLVKICIQVSFVLLVLGCNNSEHKKELNTLDRSSMLISANTLMESKEYEKAKLVYDTLIKIDSTNGEYYFKRGYCRTVLLHDDGAAISDFLRSIDHGYKNKQTAYRNIGVIYSLNRNFDSAIIYFDKCLKIDPKNHKAKIQKAEAMTHLK